MIGDNNLLPTQVGIDLAGTDPNIGIYAEQIEVKALAIGGNGVICTYQPISIMGNIYVYNATTGELKYSLLRQTIKGYKMVKLIQGNVGDIAYISYRF